MQETAATLRIESIAAGGSGVGRADGVACFVPRTAPGDLAQVSLRMRSRFATGRLLQILEPSPQRIAPRCSHYIVDRCGGCQVQHLHADAQRAAKSQIVRDALHRIARRDVALPRVEQGPSDWEYRRRLTLTLLPSGAGWIGGLHPYDEPNGVFMLSECPIAHPLLVESWRRVDALSQLLPAAATLRVALRLLDRGTVAVVIVGGSEWTHASDFASRLFATHAATSEVWWERDAGVLELVAREGDLLVQDVDTRADALAFVQINEAVGTMLRDWVVQQVALRNPRQVLDVYAGSGLLTETLARRGIAVTSIEIDANATRRAAERVAGLAGVRILTGGAESLLPEHLRPVPDAIVVNPPRRGLEPGLPQLLNEAASAGTQCIVYVSCDPATLARDLSGMPDWTITEVHCFDMFPQTAHVETVCLLEPGHAT